MTRRREVWQALKPLAKEMRARSTAAEEALWEILRGNQLEGRKFRRQHSIGPFIVDFYCSRSRLVIEVDGGVHSLQAEQDAARQSFLQQRGLRVMRFSNEDVLSGAQSVVERIREILLAASSPSPDAGEGAGGEA